MSQPLKNFFKSKTFKSLLLIIILGGFVFVFFFLKNTQVLPQGAISLLEELPQFTLKDRVLIFSPHPDDETLCCSALIKRLTNKGINTFIVVVTDGNYKNLKAKRFEEFNKVMNFLGVDSKNLIFLNYPDKKLKEISPLLLQKSFNDSILKISPTIVIFPLEEDYHLDHHLISKNLKVVLKKYPQISSYQYLIHHQYFPQPLGYHPYKYLLPPISLLKFHYHFKKLSLEPEEISIKKQAIFLYQTQIKNMPLKEILPAFVKLNELFVLED